MGGNNHAAQPAAQTESTASGNFWRRASALRKQHNTGDTEAIYEAYVKRMVAMNLPVASKETYLKITSHIELGLGSIAQHKRTGRDKVPSHMPEIL